MNPRAGLAPLLLALAACAGPAREGSATPARGARAVKTVQVVRDGSADEVPVPGSVQARRRAALSARAPASITALPYQEGERVPAGAIVVRLADAAPRAAVSAAAAAAQAAESDLERARTLVAVGAVAPRDLEHATARASLAKAQLEAAQDDLAYATLRAPFAGRVAARPAHVGDVVSPGVVLIEIEGEDGLELVATVEAELAAGLRPGVRLQALVDGQPGPLAAVVTALAPSGDATTHRVEVKAGLAVAAGLRAGLFARLLVPGGAAESRLSVPPEALFERGGLTGLFVVREGSARLRWVAAGSRGARSVEIRAGVDAGERVVLEPAGLLDGDIVREEG